MASIPSFIAKKIKETFRSLLHLENSLGATSSASQLYDGAGNALPVTFSTTLVDISALSVNTNPVLMDFQATPSNPPSSHIYLYAKSDKHLYILDSTGTESDLTGGGSSIASTDDLPEGVTNLYYTAARFNTAFGAKSTTDLAEGTNLYYTAARFNTAFSAKSTTDLAEGSNLYYTTARFDTALATKTTTNLAEGTNLYYTDERVDDRVSSLIQNGTGITWSYNDGLGTLTPTVTITQYTDELAQDAVGSILQTTTSITPTYDDGLNTISLAVNDEYVQDTVGAMVSGNTETGITVTYQDADGTIDFVVSDLTVAGDTGSTGMTPGDTLTIAGGTNCTSAMSGDTLTINVDDAFLLNTGDVGTGVYDFGGATSLEIPNGTNPTVNVAGQIALDTDGDGSTIKSGVIKVYDGTQTVYAVMATGYPSSDNDVPAYDSATNRVVWQAQTGSGGGISNVVEDTTPQLGGQLDVNGFAIGDGSLELITFTETASAVNHINITNNSTGNSPKIEAAGDDTNIDLTLDGKGSGVVKTTSSNLDITGNIIVSGTVDGRDIATDGTKLDGIEALADVTDATNVDAAGAVMNSDTSTAAMSFVIDEDNMASDLATKVPTQQSVKAYVDTKVAAYQPLDSDLTTLSTAFTTASASGAASLKFHEDTDNGSNAVTLQGPSSTADVTITLPASSGTVALTSDITGTNSGTNTGDQNLFQTISVSGQSDVVADSTTDTLTLVAGTNVTITTDAATDSITINASGGGGNSFETISVSGQSDVVADSTTDTLTLAAGTAIGITTNAGTDTITFAVTDAELAALAGLTSAADKIPMFSGSGTATLLDFKDEDTMSSNSATAIPSQQSVKAYVDANAGSGGLTLGKAYPLIVGQFSN